MREGPEAPRPLEVRGRILLELSLADEEREEASHGHEPSCDRARRATRTPSHAFMALVRAAGFASTVASPAPAAETR